MIDESSITPEMREAAERIIDQGIQNTHDAYAAVGANVIPGDSRIEAILNPGSATTDSSANREKDTGRANPGKPFTGVTRGESEGEVTPVGHEPFVDLTEEDKARGRAGLEAAREALKRATEK